MPTRNFVDKLILDSKGYQSGMDQATRALEKFGKQNLSVSAAMKVVTSTMAKFLSVAALVKGAQEAITATINGSQTTADQFNATLTAAKDTVNTFFSSLSTGDFSQFNMGLDNMIAKSKEAYMALDRLGNASMSWGYFQTARMADLTDLQAVVINTFRASLAVHPDSAILDFPDTAGRYLPQMQDEGLSQQFG